MKIQSIASEAYYKTASANNVNVKSQKVMERPNTTFGGNYSQEFKKALKMPIREHYDTCIILNTLRKALKDENIVISQAYRRFMNYTAGEFISYGAKERNLIIAETVEMNNKPLMSIDGDGYLRVRDLNSTGELIFFYNYDDRQFEFMRYPGDDRDPESVTKESYLYWSNGMVKEKTTTTTWNGGSTSETEYFDSKGKRSSFWRNLFV